MKTAPRARRRPVRRAGARGRTARPGRGAGRFGFGVFLRAGEKRSDIERRASSFRKQKKEKKLDGNGAFSARCSHFRTLPTRVDTNRYRSQCGPRNGKPFQQAEGSGNGEREKLRAIRRALTANRATSLSFPLAFSRVLKPPLPFSYRGRDRQHGIPLPSGEARPERARAAPGRRAIHRTRRRRRRSRRRRRCCCSRCRDGAGPVRGGELFSGRGGGGCGPARPQTCCAAGGARGQREGKRERGRIR